MEHVRGDSRQLALSFLKQKLLDGEIACPSEVVRRELLSVESTLEGGYSSEDDKAKRRKTVKDTNEGATYCACNQNPINGRAFTRLGQAIGGSQSQATSLDGGDDKTPQGRHDVVQLNELEMNEDEELEFFDKFSSDLDTHEVGCREDASKARAIVECESISFNGKEFHTGEFYSYGHDQGTNIVKIASILRHEEAAKTRVKCVKLQSISLSATFMEKESQALQDMACARLITGVLTIRLVELGDKIKAPLIYDGIKKGSYHFAYYRDDHFGESKTLKGRAPKFMDTFCGAGGFSAGAKMAGLKTTWAIDKDENALIAFQLNHGDTKVFREDIHHLIPKVKENTEAYPKPGEPEYLHCSPSCSFFSAANCTPGGGKEGRANGELSYRFVDIVRYWRPVVATYEMVTGILRPDFRKYLQKIIADLIQMGRQVRCDVLNAQDFGDPQRRLRLVLYTAETGYILPQSPRPTHGPRGNDAGLLPYVPVKKAIGFLSGKKPDDEGVLRIGSKTIYNNTPKNSSISNDACKRVACNKVATTQMASKVQLHYSEDRYLTPRETACLQSFPIQYRFHGSIADQYRQVGNAIPIRLAIAIVRSVQDALM